MDKIVKIKRTKDAIIFIVKCQLMKWERAEIEAHYQNEKAFKFYRSILDGKPA